MSWDASTIANVVMAAVAVLEWIENRKVKKENRDLKTQLSFDTKLEKNLDSLLKHLEDLRQNHPSDSILEEMLDAIKQQYSLFGEQRVIYQKVENWLGDRKKRSDLARSATFKAIKSWSGKLDKYQQRKFEGDIEKYLLRLYESLQRDDKDYSIASKSPSPSISEKALYENAFKNIGDEAKKKLDKPVAERVIKRINVIFSYLFQ